MRRFNESYLLLEEMYEDQYYPKFLVDKLKFILMDFMLYLDKENHPKGEVQEKLDEMTIHINNL